MVRPISNSNPDSLPGTPGESKDKSSNPLLSVDPRQMYILSGPFPSNDPNCGVLIACPIPPGSTVIAKPMLGAPVTPPFDLSHESVRPLDRTSFLDQLHNQNIDTKGGNSKNPMVMIWNAEHPEGKLMPLRQPAPPVYFQPHTRKSQSAV